jgi:hypothetical protein
MRPKIVILLMALLLFIALQVASAADNREIGGYVYKGEERFVRNVWHFISQFTPDENVWEAVGGHNWYWKQYYWCKNYEFTTSHQDYVDKMDLAYYSGHGSPYSIGMGTDGGPSVNLSAAPKYGDLVNGGDLEFIIFQSCAVIPSPDDRADWYTPWRTGIYGEGLHMACGYRTNSNSDNSISTNFGLYCKFGCKVWESWFNAVNIERTLHGGGAYPGYACAFMHPSCANDTIYHYAADPTDNAMWIVWQRP